MSEDDFALWRRQIETQMEEYTRAIGEYAAFMEQWRTRNSPSERRLQRFRAAAAEAAE